jgi:hypothetical protein
LSQAIAEEQHWQLKEGDGELPDIPVDVRGNLILQHHHEFVAPARRRPLLPNTRKTETRRGEVWVLEPRRGEEMKI